VLDLHNIPVYGQAEEKLQMHTAECMKCL